MEETVEILVSDSSLRHMGSQFGHVAVDIDGTVYGRAVSILSVNHKVNYILRQQVNMRRDTWGYTLAVTKAEKDAILNEIQKQRKENKPYNLINNSCSSAMVNVFGVTDILIVDPRWSLGGMLSPSDIMDGLNKSPRVIKRRIYPKK
ncbi:DUF4105 domain-containing protein [Neisseria sp. Dent CA1/247]|uniref:lipoprotein N-acyltransferase Lnb domain-containing protein n=1 Tax=Neisseria sp. Dent CA1/247 TaxID=2912675 RepID=UPI001FD47D18|nr:DUF4105 domain-containing protein [Neisseria sp. Dent CA1/247]UOO76923.1 DUF4105 domain-containing protein [Neisseria sp. Dent CA1/247]